MVERCAESWKLHFDLARQEKAAIQEGIPPRLYLPLKETLFRYRAHFRACPQCRAWWEELSQIGGKQDGLNHHQRTY